jgi:hypothetical protein
MTLTVDVVGGPGTIDIMGGLETTNTEEDAGSTPDLLAMAPEPGGLVFLGMALAGLGFARRRS